MAGGAAAFAAAAVPEAAAVLPDIERLASRLQRVYRALENAADAGMPCPSNEALADLTGVVAATKAGSVLGELERRGFISMRRARGVGGHAGRVFRVVTITASGRSTRAPGQPLANLRYRNGLDEQPGGVLPPVCPPKLGRAVAAMPPAVEAALPPAFSPSAANNNWDADALAPMVRVRLAEGAGACLHRTAPGQFELQMHGVAEGGIGVLLCLPRDAAAALARRLLVLAELAVGAAPAGASA